MELDPASLTLEEMMQMDSFALDQMARKSTGSLTRYRALLGRLLLAIHRTDAYLEHGCSSGVHYAILQLGLSRKEARVLLLVARELESLPYLRYLANNATSNGPSCAKSCAWPRRKRNGSGQSFAAITPTPRSKLG